MNFQDHSVTPRPMPTQTISLGTPSAGCIINTTNEVITLRYTSSRRRELSLFSHSGLQDGMSFRLWRSQLPASLQESDVTLTAVLPLAFNSIIFGYSEFCESFMLTLLDVHSFRRWPPPQHLILSANKEPPKVPHRSITTFSSSNRGPVISTYFRCSHSCVHLFVTSDSQ